MLIPLAMFKWFTVILALFLVSCGEEGLKLGRDYSGFLTAPDFGTGKLTQFPVNAVVTSTGISSYRIQVTSLSNSQTWSFELRAFLTGGFGFKLNVDEKEISFSESVEDCYLAYQEGRAAERICVKNSEIIVDLFPKASRFSLVLGLKNATHPELLEKPRVFTASELLVRSMSSNFETLMEFHRVLQAKFQMKASYLSLLPHLSIQSIMGLGALPLGGPLLVQGALGALSGIGDIIPFMMPNRWFFASEMGHRYEAEKEGLVLAKADATNIVEGLTYGVLRDEAIVRRLNKAIAYTSEIRDEISSRENLGFLPRGMTNDMNSVVNGIEKMVPAVEKNILQGYAEIALAAGMHNPEAVAQILLPESLVLQSDDDAFDGPDDIVRPIDSHHLSDSSSRECLEELAVERSHEVVQINHLILATQENKNQRFFNWLDPLTGDYASGLGFSMKPYVLIGHSQIDELKERENYLRALVREKVKSTLSDLDQSYILYQKSMDGLKYSLNRIRLIRRKLSLGIGFDMSGLILALQSHITNEIDKVAAEFSYYVALSNKQRLLFAPPYSYASLNALDSHVIQTSVDTDDAAMGNLIKCK